MGQIIIVDDEGWDALKRLGVTDIKKPIERKPFEIQYRPDPLLGVRVIHSHYLTKEPEPSILKDFGWRFAMVVRRCEGRRALEAIDRGDMPPEERLRRAFRKELR